MEEDPYPQRPRLLGALAAAQSVATHEIASAAQAKGLQGPKVGEMIQSARMEAVDRWLSPG
jgi:tRNA nucleotidyltransferase (CCA-adding enzyme)